MSGATRSKILLVATVLLIASGCGTSDYNQLVDRGVATLRSSVKFHGLFGPSTIPGTPYSVRVPVLYTNSYNQQSAHPDDGDKINPQRLQAPFMPASLPTKLMFEGTVKEGNRKLPFYCYITAVEAKPGDADRIASEIATGLKSVSPDQAPVWEPVDADTPTGKAIPWRRIRAEGEQPFMVKVDDQLEIQKLPGVYEVWLHEDSDQVVMIGWRAPKSIEGPQTNDIQVSGGLVLPVPNAKPDLSKWPVLTAGTLERSAAAAPP
jgi:hypothetical protein